MRFLATYYPFILYAIPYVIAAVVLIRARVKERRAERERHEAAAAASRVDTTSEGFAPANRGSRPRFAYRDAG